MDHTKTQPSKNTTLPLSEKSSDIHTNDDTDPNINLDDDIDITQHEAVDTVQDDCDIANAGEHAEQLNLSSQCTDIDKKEEGHTGNQDLEGPTLRDIMYFRDHLLEMVEELRIRRVAERGYDEQITAMRKDNQKLQEINAGLLSQLADMESTHTTSIAETEKSHQAMLTAAKKIEEKKVNVAENLEKENEALKMEIQTFKVKEYEKEKQVTDLERSLQLLSSNKDWGMKQLVTIEETCHQLTSKLEHIEERRLKLEANVEKATELNKSLTLVNLHQECMTEELRQENKELQSLLRETRVQKHKEPVEDNQKLTQAKLTVEKLNQQHKLLCTEIGDLKQDLEKADIKHKVDAKLLEECHLVLSKQVDCGEAQTVQIKQLEDNLNAQQDKHTSLEELHRETDNKLKEKEELCNQLKETLEVKENELTDRYTRLNEEYKQLVISHTSLEDLNTKWSDTNLQLTNQIQQLKDEAKKVDQLDALVQTDNTPTNNTHVQTDTAHKMEHSTQTYIDIVPNKGSQKVSSTTEHSTQTYTDSSSSPHPENQEVINESLVCPTASVSGGLVIESTKEVLKSPELGQSTKSVAGAPNKQSQKLSTTFPVSNEINSEPVGIPTTKDTTTIEGLTNKPFIASSYTDADLSASVETLGADEPQSQIDISNVHDTSKKDKASKVMDTVNEDAIIIPATPIERTKQVAQQGTPKRRHQEVQAMKMSSNVSILLNNGCPVQSNADDRDIPSSNPQLYQPSISPNSKNTYSKAASSNHLEMPLQPQTISPKAQTSFVIDEISSSNPKAMSTKLLLIGSNITNENLNEQISVPQPICSKPQGVCSNPLLKSVIKPPQQITICQQTPTNESKGKLPDRCKESPIVALTKTLSDLTNRHSTPTMFTSRDRSSSEPLCESSFTPKTLSSTTPKQSRPDPMFSVTTGGVNCSSTAATRLSASSELAGKPAKRRCMDIGSVPTATISSTDNISKGVLSSGELFSDDEDDQIELGSQLTRIEKFLKQDKLKITKKPLTR